jgi:transposase
VVLADSVALLEATSPGAGAMFELTDQAFTRVQPSLPAHSRRGKPWRDHRQVLGGIMWKLHTGRPWRDVPGRFGPWQTCYGRLRRWQADGTWPRIWALLAAGEHDSATIAAARPARRRCRRRQWQRRARVWWRRRHHDHHSTWRTVGGVHHTSPASSRRASAVEI